MGGYQRTVNSMGERFEISLPSRGPECAPITSGISARLGFQRSKRWSQCSKMDDLIRHPRSLVQRTRSGHFCVCGGGWYTLLRSILYAVLIEIQRLTESLLTRRIFNPLPPSFRTSPSSLASALSTVSFSRADIRSSTSSSSTYVFPPPSH